MIPGRAGTLAGGGALAVIALLMAADFALLPSRRALTCARELQESVGIGDTVEGAYKLESRWPRALTLELQDRLSPFVSGGVRSTAATFPPFSSRSIAFHVTGETRGRAPLGIV